ncbi:hypothetical protein SBF1_4480002 [Candidatus Desulfosporosinus infrequens]|uniref:Uncharacterized protein n=1 Tax=Candidatus Desulfosporosinus infrequens TaxID=2043169 RepID=A0A2U3LBM3_9FIRM|nr:hypothetical protein SBF1_4480002 [Candidatus Desulfosporosinus infrequens]
MDTQVVASAVPEAVTLPPTTELLVLRVRVTLVAAAASVIGNVEIGNVTFRHIIKIANTERISDLNFTVHLSLIVRRELTECFPLSLKYWVA